MTVDAPNTPVTPAEAAAALGRARAARTAWTPPDPASLAGLIPNLEVEALIGQGGMGAVYRARQTHLERVVALKILAPRLTDDPAFVARFQREALALARLDHPGIVRLYESGSAGGYCWMLLEYVDGASLRDLLRTGRMAPHEALRLVEPLAAALQYAHDRGVVHRDLKPENVLIGADGRLRIVDFGLAKVPGAAAAGLTAPGDVLGTAHYLAPEQLAGRADVDHRADIYAFGVMLYELLTGELPVGRFASPSRLQDLDERIDLAVLRALERDPGRRWQRVSEIAGAVAPDGAAPAAAAAPPPAGTPRRSWLHRVGRSSRDRWLAGICGGLGEHTALPGWSWRLLFAAAALCYGIGLVAYLLLLVMPVRADPPPQAGAWHVLRLSRADRVVAGLCGGLGRLELLPAWCWRLVFLLGLLLWGLGLLVYIVLWIVLPREPRGA